MKRILLLLSFFAINLTGCPNKSTPPVTDAGTDFAPDVVEHQKIEYIVSGDTWQVTLPISWKEKVPLPHSQDVALLAENESTQGMFLLTKETYTDSFDAFAIETLRGLRRQGSTIIMSESTSLNGEPFVHIKSSQESLVVHTWLTVKDSYGYSINCGGVVSDIDLLSVDCQSIADSFKLR
jgi:hypothetical protein